MHEKVTITSQATIMHFFAVSLGITVRFRRWFVFLSYYLREVRFRKCLFFVSKNLQRWNGYPDSS